MEYPQPVASVTSTNVGNKPIQRTASDYYSDSKENGPEDAEKGAVDQTIYDHRADEGVATSQARRAAFWGQYRPFILGGIAAVILGWWISSTVLKATRHRW
jgi:concentrative nucleoside transporter, CNT family